MTMPAHCDKEPLGVAIVNVFILLVSILPAIVLLFVAVVVACFNVIEHFLIDTCQWQKHFQNFILTHLHTHLFQFP